ncbi:mu-type opioid receptor-like [Antedon mediterranea]|uniref:mu-type opioid receptor-like n=1 Tax=Antedon mediterranea TaxID=105859 RepID=UPI003AF427EC
MINSTDHTGLIVSRMLACSVGIVANLLVIVVFLYNRLFRKSLYHMLILHQSIVDFSGCCLFLGFYNNDAPIGKGATAFCKSRYIFWYMSSTSIYNLVMLTVERYIAVIYPIFYHTRHLGRRRAIPLVASHVLGALASLQLVFLAEAKLENPGECKYNYGTKGIQIFSGIFHFTANWLIPVSIMGYCYAQIYKRVRRRSVDDGGVVQRTQTNLLSTLIFVCVAFLITITPNLVLYLIYCICNCFEFSEITLHEVTVLFYTINLCINPFIYSIKFNDFQVGIIKLKRNICFYIRKDNLESEMTSVGKSSET